MRLKNFFKNEYIFSVFTKFFTLAVALVQSILIARFLGAELKGEYSYIYSIVSVASIIITFGLHQAYPYFRKQMGKDAIYTDFISVVYALYFFYLVIAVLISLAFTQNGEIRTAVLLTPVYGYERVIAYVYLVEQPNRRNTWWSIISVVDLLFVLALMLWTTRGFYSVVLILVFAEVLKAVVFTVLSAVRPVFHKEQIDLTVQLFRMGFFPMLALLMTTLNYKIDILMLRHFEFITAAQIGIYSVGMSFADKIVLIPDSLKGVLVSKLSKGAGEQEVAKVSRLCFWASVSVCLVLLLIGEPLLLFLYGQEYNGAYSVLMICAFGSIFVGYFKLIAQYNIVNKKQVRNVVLLSISIVVNVILNLLLIPKYGLNGAAFASGVGYFLSGWIFIVWFAKSNGIPLSEMFLIQKSDIKLLLKGRKEK